MEEAGGDQEDTSIIFLIVECAEHQSGKMALIRGDLGGKR